MSIRVHSWLSIGLYCLPLAWLWFRLIDHLRIEWSVNPAYGFGWAVPFLCAYLLWQRLRAGAGKTSNIGSRTGSSGSESPLRLDLVPRSRERERVVEDRVRAVGMKTSSCGEGQREVSHPYALRLALPALLLFALLALLYAPTRLVQEANPEWRLISWALALIVIGLTLMAIRLIALPSPLRAGRGQGEVSNSAPRPPSAALVFPLLYFLVAVPWPTIVEGRLIQWLTGANVSVTIELLGLFGVPAVQHGNVIEISTGVVGVDDACSGIRSFQATLMISLFFGELYSLTALRRVVCVLLGFALSFIFNVGRTFLLTYVASKQGVSAIENWHDPAGVTVLVWCFVALWLASLVLKRDGRDTPQSAKRKDPTDHELQTTDSTPFTPSLDPSVAERPVARPGGAVLSTLSFPPSTTRSLAIGLAAWLVLVEVGVEWWYRSHEKNMPATTAWSAAFPTDNAAFRELPFTDKTRQFLRYDEGRNCAWQEDDGTRWQGIYLRWNPGKIAVHLAKSHTPEVCLSAAGRKMVAKSSLQVFQVNGLPLPFFAYVFEGQHDRVHVFYCLWEDRAADQDFNTEALTYGNRLAPVLAGRRNSGQRTLELAVWGLESQEQATAALEKQLEKLIRVQP